MIEKGGILARGREAGVEAELGQSASLTTVGRSHCCTDYWVFARYMPNSGSINAFEEDGLGAEL